MEFGLIEEGLIGDHRQREIVPGDPDPPRGLEAALPRVAGGALAGDDEITLRVEAVGAAGGRGFEDRRPALETLEISTTTPLSKGVSGGPAVGLYCRSSNTIWWRTIRSAAPVARRCP